MRPTVFLLAGVLLGSGCAGLREAERAQSVRVQELEARAEESSARAASEAAEREKANAALQEARKQVAELLEEQQRARARAEDLSTRLRRCDEREAAEAADLDLCRKGKAVCEEVGAKRNGELSALQAASEEELQKRDVELERLRGRVADLEAQAGLLSAEKRRAELERAEKVEELTHSYDELLAQAKVHAAECKESEQALLGPRLKACGEGDEWSRRLSEALGPELAKRELLLGRAGAAVTLGLPEDAFRGGGAELTPQSRQLMGKVGAVLKEVRPKQVSLTATATPERKPKKGRPQPGTQPGPWDVAALRAAQVAAVLERAGVEKGSLSFAPALGAKGDGRASAVVVSVLPEEPPCPAQESGPKP